MVKIFLGAAAAMALIATAAHASDIPDLISVTPSGADFLFTYQADLAPDQGLTYGDQLAIVDFAGYVPGSVSSTNPDWSASVSNTLPATLLSLPGSSDSAGVPDLIFTYIGPTYRTTGGPYPSQTAYNGLSALSTFGDTATGSFSASAVKNSDGTQNTPTYNVGSVGVPIGSASAAPEPASWALMLIGIGGVGATLRGKRRKASRTVATA